MELIDVIKIGCLFISLLYTTSIICKLYLGDNLPAPIFVVHSAGLAGFIYLQWLAD